MVDFRWQLDRAKDAQIAAKTWFPGVSLRVSPGERSIWGSRFPSPVWVGARQVIEELRSQKVEGEWLHSLSLKMRHPSSPAFRHWHSWFSDFGIQIGVCTISCLILSPLDLDWLIAACLILQLTDSRSWGCLASITMWANFCNKSLTSSYLFI